MKFLKKLYCLIECMGSARAAGVATRLGKYDLAKNIMANTCNCKC